MWYDDERVIDINGYDSGGAQEGPSAWTYFDSVGYTSDDELSGCPVREIAASSADYPGQIRTALHNGYPERLFCMGNAALLKERQIMICGSRNSSETGRKLAFDCGCQLARRGYSVASGYARGIDMAAHYGALEVCGGTVAVIPYGILKLRMKSALRECAEAGLFLVVSEYPPMYPFTVHGAFRRNKILVALAEAVIVIEPGDTGGTWHSARCARKMGRRLFYLEGERPESIPQLESLGAVRLEVINDSPDLSVLYDELERGSR